MAASDWIQCRIHPGHPKVLTVARLTGDTPAEACGKVVAWFWHVDQHFAGNETNMDIKSFLSVVLTRKKRNKKANYFEAFSHPDVNWIELSEHGTINIVDYEDNFSKSSKRRAQGRIRKQRQRAREACLPYQDGMVIDHEPEPETVTPSVTPSETFSGPRDIERIKSAPSKQVPERSQPREAGVAAVVIPDEALNPDILAVYEEVEIALNKRTKAIAHLAFNAWGNEASDKIAHIIQRCLDTNKGPGIMVEEMEAGARKAMAHKQAMDARRKHMQENPTKAMTPEQTKADQVKRLKRYGWQRIRQAIRAKDLYRRPSIKGQAVFQAEILRDLEAK